MTGNWLTTAEELCALPVGSVVRGHYQTLMPLRPWEVIPATMDLFVTASLLVAERYECAKGAHAIATFSGGFEVLHHPDAPAQPITVKAEDGECADQAAIEILEDEETEGMMTFALGVKIARAVLAAVGVEVAR